MAYEDTHSHLKSSECHVLIGGRTMISITGPIQPFLAVLCPALGSILILIFGRRRNVRETWTLLASLFQFLVVLSMVPTILNGKRITCYLFTMFPGIDFGFHQGPVTLLNLTQFDAEDTFKLIYTFAEAVPGDILNIGNPNCRIRVNCPIHEFIDAWCQQGPSHHIALGIGDQSNEIESFAEAMNFGCVRI